MKKLLLSAILLVFLFTQGCAPKNTQGPEAINQKSGSQASDPTGRYSWPNSVSDLEQDPAMTTGKFENGLRYVIMKNKKPEGRVSIHLNIQAGSGYENQGEEGIAHFLEHMLFNGTKSYPPGELVKYFQSIGMDYGSDLNARTSYDTAIYDIMLPSGDEKNMDKGLSVLSEFAEDALLLPDEVENEKGVILSEKRVRNSAEYRIAIATQKFIFNGLRITERIPIGSEEVIKTANTRLIKDFYDAWYRPDRMMVVIVGETDVKKAEDLVKKHFSGIKPRAEKRQEPELGTVDHKGTKAFYQYEKEAGGTTVSINTVRSVPAKPDTIEAEKDAMVKMMAMGILQERLDSIARKKNSPFTKVYSGTGISLREIDHTAVYASCEQKNWESALSSISKEIETALKFGFDKAESERVKKKVLSGIDREIATAPTRDSKALANEIIDSMNDGRVFISPEYQKKTFAPFIASLKAEDFEKAFKEIWKDDHRLVLLTGNADVSDKASKAEDQIIAAYENGKSLATEKPSGKTDIKFPYLKVPANPGKIIKKTKDKDLDITTLEFENGVVLHYKKTAFKADEIMMSVAFGDGKISEPKTKPGLGFISEAVMNQSGTATYLAEDLQKVLAGKNISSSFQTSGERFNYQCSSSKEDLTTLFDLVYSQISDPGFRDETLERKIKQHEQDYEGFTKSADGLMRIKAPYFLSGNDQRFMMPDPNTLKKFVVNDLKSWIAPSIAESAMEISVAGDFDEAELTRLVSAYFGSMKKKKPFTKIQQVKLNFPEGKKLDLSVKSQEKNASIHIVWPTPDIKSINDLKTIRRLNILSSVLENRLIKVVREKLGETYSPAAIFDIEMNYEGSAGIHVLINSSTEKADEIKKVAMDIAAGLSNSEITDEEFEQAINPVLTALKEKLQKNIYWVSGVMTGSVQKPEKFTWSKNAMQDHKSIKKTEVAALAKKYLDNKKAAVITVKSIEETASGVNQKS
ncbi:M16 family metallopeptidase [Desulforegula conservatrix]|uniref:M16 family metallopeptidase n=1 Tax=Desulforegula conservatrix TaxID=153026 RepID=UPI00042192E5|nr:M16 family metallopeptidase [Desulforegula conservatrix]